MIFFAGNDGTIISSVPTPVYQGASNANDVFLVAPFANNLAVTVAFKLPNGVYTERFPMTAVSELNGIVDEKTGRTYCGWKFSMPNSLTQYFGTATAQFFFYSAQSGITTASSPSSFPIEKGVPQILPATPDTDVYEAILENISALQQQLNNGAYAARAIYAWNSEYTYGANEVTYYPEVGAYGALVRSKTTDNLNNPPFNSDGVLNSQFWDIVGPLSAGVFHTLAASSTSVAISALQPKLIPLVGDAVMFPNGDVRQITAVGSSTVTLGDVLFSYKGDPGIGNATLSNIDGDSTENGFTQSAVKGVAQAKNYYNEGTSDTSVSNGDGTGTVNRKTGYLNFSDYDWELASGQTTVFYADIITGLSPSGGFRENCKSSNYQYVGGALVLSTINSFTVSNPNLSSVSSRFFVNTGDGNTLPAGIVEYELPVEYQYEEKVIENHPIRPANQEECFYWHNEWQKGLNAINFNSFNETVSNGVTCTPIYANNGLSYINLNGTANGIGLFVPMGTLPAGTYVLSKGITTGGVEERMLVGDATGTAGVDYFYAYVGTPFTIDKPTDIQYRAYWVNGFIFNNAQLRPMLCRGAIAYPPKPYYGGILHQKELPLFITATDENPAETIGGDWEDKGTATTSDGTVLHVYRRL